MKNITLSLCFAIFLVLFIACKKEKELRGYAYAMDVELKYIDQHGLPLFSNNGIHADRLDVDVTYIINGQPNDFYSSKEAGAHMLVPFIYFADENLLRLFLNHNLIDNKSTTIIKVKGYPADTLYSEFFVDEYSTILTKCTLNNNTSVSYKYADIVTIVK